MNCGSHSSGAHFVRAGSLVIVAAFFFLLAIPSSAEVTSVQANASPQQINVGDTFVYRVTVEGSGSLPTPTSNIPSAFQILSGPNSNLSMQIVNGRMSSTRSISYTLRAMRRGEHTIQAPIVTDGGKSITGNPVTIYVETPVSNQQNQSGESDKRPSVQEEPEQATPDQGAESIPPNQLQPIFLRAEIQPDTVMLQEPLVVTFTLYFQPNVRRYDLQKLPSTEGFWSEEWGLPDPPPVVERRLHGRLYNAAELYRLVLFPTRTGDLTIGPMNLMVHYSGGRRSRDIFDIFDDFLDQAQVSSEPATVHVNPLPAEGKPDDFQNVVGDWQISSTIDTDTARVNESVTLTVKVEGEGNVRYLPQPQLSVPKDIELYEPEVQENKRVVNGTVRGEKVYTYLLIPRREGVQDIPPVELTYYDPDRESYETITTEPKQIEVLPAFGWATAEEGADGAPAPVRSLATEIRWIMDSADTISPAAPPIYLRFSYWATYLLPILLIAAGAIVKQKREKLAGQESLQRSRKAAKKAIAVLKAARTHHAQGEIEAGYNALARGLIGYLSDRINEPAATLDQYRRAQILMAADVSEANRDELEQILTLCNTARFSPHGQDADTLNALLDRAHKWITSVDRQLQISSTQL